MPTSPPYQELALSTPSLPVHYGLALLACASPICGVFPISPLFALPTRLPHSRALRAQEIAAHLSKAQEDLSPLVVRQLFARVPDEDCVLLGFDPQYSRPERMILNHILVPPASIRPSVCQDASSGRFAPARRRFCWEGR